MLHLEQGNRQEPFHHTFATNITPPGGAGHRPNSARELEAVGAPSTPETDLREGKNVVSTVPESPYCSVRIGPRVKSLKL